MTDKELLQQALEWVEWFASDDHSVRPTSKARETAEAIKTRLAQPEPRVTEDMWKKLSELQQKVMEIAHTAPQKKEWVGLTYADLYFWGGELGLGELGKGVLRAVDVHLREKNSGYVSTKKEWVGLTDADWIIGKRSADYIAGAEWAEAKLKEKNHG